MNTIKPRAIRIFKSKSAADKLLVAIVRDGRRKVVQLDRPKGDTVAQAVMAGLEARFPGELA